MPRRKCNKCLYKDCCDEHKICGHFYPVDDDLLDKEIARHNAEDREEFLEQWRIYIKEADFF